ncbi:MAG: hypothetical protein NC820_01455 [Candidatus Omnitrophica bacterium]|nr:hypothetical protein [Candidatus Omnitrophota bacterium]
MKLISINIIISLLFIKTLYAQNINIDNVTKELDIFERKNIEEKLRALPQKDISPQIFPETVTPPTEKPQEKRFLIKKIELLGCQTLSPKEFQHIIEKYEGKELSYSDFKNLSNEIEQEYLKNNIIAVVVIPQQELKEGYLTLNVIEAKMGNLIIEEHKYFRESILKRYWKIKSDEVLRYDKINRYLKMMNNNPDRIVKAKLQAGEKPGTSDILLSPTTNLPLHLISSFDNEGSSFTGESKTGIGIRHNNFLTLDDMLLTSYYLGKEFYGFYIYHILPITYSGTNLIYGYSYSQVTPKQELTIYEINSKGKALTLSLHQDIYKGADYKGEVYFGIEANDKEITYKEGLLNRERLRIMNLGGKFRWQTTKFILEISPEFSQGMPWFGASGDDNPFASRGAKREFSKFNLNSLYKIILLPNIQANIKFATQLSSRKLPPQEGLELGGIDSVRGYPSGDYTADIATLESIEILTPLFIIPNGWQIPYVRKPFRDISNLLLFFDHGWGKKRGALATEKRSANLLSMGLGLRLNLFNSTNLRLEWGFPIASNHPLSEEGNSRFHFAVELQK